MRIGCVGAGPAGLYFAISMLRQDPTHEVAVFERDPAGLTYGWGVTLWGDLLAKLHDRDPQSALEIREGSFRWEDQVVHVQGKGTVHLMGASGFSISRRALLDILTRRAIDLGAQVQFEHALEDLSELADRDLIVACDGVNSRLRRLHADRFQAKVDVGPNKYVWLGTTRVFDTFTYAFVQTEAGWIWFYAYGFDSATSTCIVECSPTTWTGLGLDALGTDEGMALLSRAFERYLDGHPLMVQSRDPEGTPWLNFRTITNRRWHYDNVVLMGDAAHTTHFSIGSGTRLAIEDAIGLADQLHRHGGAGSALGAYERERRGALGEPSRRARRSARWFESISRYVELEAPQFAILLARRGRFTRPLAKMPARMHWRLYRAGRTASVWWRRLRAGASSKPSGAERGVR
jgi:2-polyprenyl-6-methoxyphenol hydroxylase-like FAD-dependent oxidoreductase